MMILLLGNGDMSDYELTLISIFIDIEEDVIVG